MFQYKTARSGFWYFCLAIQCMKSPSHLQWIQKKHPNRAFSQRPMQLQRRRCCRHISLLQLQPPPLQLFHGVNRGVTMNLTLKSIHRTVIEQLVTYEKWQASTRKPECPQRRLPQKFQTCPFFLDKRWGDMS